MLKFFQRFGLVLAISSLMLIGLSNIAHSQECQYIPKDEGGDHYLIIDGRLFFYMSMEHSVALLKDVERCHLQDKELRLYREQVEIQDRLLNEYEDIHKGLLREIEFQKDLLNRSTRGETVFSKFVRNPYINFGLGVLVGGAAVGIVYHYGVNR